MLSTSGAEDEGDAKCPPYSRAELIQLWSLQDMLLQTYRAKFLAAQALLLGLGAHTPGWEFWPLFVIAAILLLQQVKICGARGRIVSRIQLTLIDLDRGIAVKGMVKTIKDWERGDRRATRPEGREDQHAAVPRGFFNLVLPLLLIVTWIIFAAHHLGVLREMFATCPLLMSTAR